VRRRAFITLLGGAAVWPLAARAQQKAMPVVGFLEIRSPETIAGRLRAFRQGLKETGYVEGENVAIDYRWAEQIDRLPDLATDLVRRQVAVIATAAGFTTALAAKGATTTIPIVFSVSEDPVKSGLVTSLARPGGNLTGINLLGLELTAKRLELLREMLPAVARVAVLVNPANTANAQITLREVEAAGRAMGLQLQIFNASTSREIDVAFAAFGRERPDAVFVGQDAFFNGRRSPSRSTANGCIGSLVAFGHRCRPRASCWWRTMRCSASGCADGSRVRNGLYARPRTVARRSNVSKRASRT
jgi:putative ABC transport system substrate-binding protein